MSSVESNRGLRQWISAERKIVVLFELMALAFWALGQGNQPVSLLGLWLLAAFVLGISSPVREAPSVLNTANRRSAAVYRLGIWRWIFLGSLASLLTVMFIGLPSDLFPSFRGLGLSGQLLGVVYTVATVFLLHVSPFFFRRLGGLAVVAWFVSTFAALTLVAPRF